MKRNLIWRITKGPGNASANSVLGGLPGNRVIDIPAERVTVWWGTNSPYANTNLGVNTFNRSAARFYIRNGTLAQKNDNQNTNNDFVIFGNNTNGAVISRAQLIDRAGFGRVLYDYSV